MKQRARELGALPLTGLVRPGEVFDWPVLEPWADAVEDDEPVTAGNPNEPPAASFGPGFGEVTVVPGDSQPAPPRSARRSRGPRQAVTE